MSAPQGQPSGRLNNPTQTPLFHALYEDRYRRQAKIAEIEAHTSRTLLCWVASPNSEINKDDIPPIADLLQAVSPDEDVDLLLQSPGGDIDTAEKIVGMLRHRSKSLRVIVAESAKSAATLLAIAADAIVMGYISELGPIDPQVFITTPGGQPLYRPAHSFLDGFEQIKADVQETGQLSPAYLPMLQHYDPALLDYCRKAIERSRVFAEGWLNQYQCKGDPIKAAQIAEALGDVKKHLSHGAVIDHEAAESMGLCVCYLDPADELWEAIWRLYCQYVLALQRSGAEQIFESTRASVHY